MTSAVITAEIQKLAPGAIIELFVLDTTSIGGDISYFHSGTNELNTNIIWQGQEYQRYPVEASGFEYTGNGQLPRPKIRVSNAFGAITALILELGDMVGTKVIRRRTLKKCLDVANFDGGINPEADPSVEWPEEIYFIDRKASESPELVEFELAAAPDLQGVLIPKRQIIQNLCPFIYRGADCGYAGPPTFDFEDNAMTSASTVAGQAMLDAYHDMLVKKQLWITSITTTETAKKAQEIACDYIRMDNFFGDSPEGVPLNYGVVIYTDRNKTAYWNSVAVALGITYRLGSYVSTFYAGAGGGINSSVGGNFYKIERWAVDTVNCNAKTATYNAAVIAQAAALVAYNTSVNTYQALFLALPLNDPLYALDVCGKRVTSCKVRFGEDNPLSFGGFPSASLIK